MKYRPSLLFGVGLIYTLMALSNAGCGGLVPGPCFWILDQDSYEAALEEARHTYAFSGAATEAELVADLVIYDEIVSYFCFRTTPSGCDACRRWIADIVFSELECQTDEHCDDGVWCNGVEACSAFGMCVAAGSPCGTGTCNEEQDRCE